MVKLEKLKVYSIKHSAFRDDVEFLVEAESITDAIDKFMEYHNDDYEVRKENIESSVLKYNFEVIK